MGYTHYWYRKPELPKTRWTTFLADVLAIMRTTKVPLANGAGEKNTMPLLNMSEIMFNGVDDDAFETFHIERVFSGYRQENSKGQLFSCCKTSGTRPYDAVVCAVLLAFKANFPGVSVSSDGTWEEWGPGAKLYEKATGQKATNPLED